MEKPDQQVHFFQYLKNRNPQHLSFVDEISQILHISEDSAYRRIRGDKLLAFAEIRSLCIHYKVSLDQLLDLPTNNILFSGRFINPGEFNFKSYLESMLVQFRAIMPNPDKELIYLCKDIPVYHYYLFPEIVSFKYFSWMKTLLNFPDLKDAKFSVGFMPEDLFLTGRKIAEAYYQVPSIEILNPDNILTTLRQIEYYKDSGLFASADDINKVYNSLEAMVGHMKDMAALGKKFLPGKDPSFSRGDYKLYVNDFYVGDNTNLLRVGENLTCFIVHGGTNFIQTTNRNFCEYSFTFIKNIISNSAYISEVAEKERNRFFELILSRIRIFRESKVNTMGKI
jgi:hypothetical protein